MNRDHKSMTRTRVDRRASLSKGSRQKVISTKTYDSMTARGCGKKRTRTGRQGRPKESNRGVVTLEGYLPGRGKGQQQQERFSDPLRRIIS